MSSVMLGAEPTAAEKIAAIVAARKAGTAKPIPLIVKKADGTAVQIDDPAKQQEFITRAAFKPPAVVLDEMIAEAKATPKKSIPVLAIAGAAVAAYLMFR